MTTRPPGDVARPGGAPITSVPSTGGAAAGGPVATPTATPAPAPPRPPAIDAAGALRVFLEEVRATAQTQLVQAARPASLPPLADADPGNAAAALLRWLRAAVADAPVPPSALRDVVERAYARAAETLQRAATAAPPTVRTDAPLPQDVLASAREALASARELVLRGLGGDARAAAARPPIAPDVPEEASAAVTTPARGAAARPDVARVEPIGAERAATRTAAPLAATGARGPAPASAVASPSPIATTPGSGPPAVAPATAVRAAPAIDPMTALRSFVDEVRSELQRSLGPSRMPSSPPPLVTDPRGASLAPALLRWLTTAVAEKGAPLAPLQDAVRTAFARVDATLAAGASAASSSEPSGPIAQVRETLMQVRDQVLRGLGFAPDRDDRGVARLDAPAARVDVRPDPGAVDPRGIPVPTGAPVVRSESAKDRVEAIAPERAGRTGRELEPVDESPDGSADERRDGADLQGPMDCVRRYFDAYLAGDSVAYAAQWVYPACVWSEGRWSAYLDERACAAGNDAYTARMRAQGIVGGRIVMLRVEPTSEDAAVVHGVFTRERVDGTVAGEVEAAYTTVRTDAGWRVAVCIVKPKAADA